MEKKIVIAGSSFNNYLYSIQRAFIAHNCDAKVIPCDRPSQNIDYLERLLYRTLPQYKITIFQETAWKHIRNEFLHHLELEPFDLLLLIRPDFLTIEMINYIRTIKPNAILACWLMDPLERLPGIEPLLSRLDYVFLYNAADLPTALKLNSQTSILPLAFDPQDFHLSNARVDQYKWDLSFVGNLRDNRLDILEKFCKNLGLQKDKVQIYGGDWSLLPLIGRIKLNKQSWLYKQNYISLRTIIPSQACKVYQQSYINLNIHQPGSSEGYNMRMFEIAGAGGFQMVDRLPGLEKCFIEDNEIVTYQTLDELVSKARYYFTKIDERNRIAFNGYKKAIMSHTFSHRVDQILDECHLNNRSQKIGKVP